MSKQINEVRLIATKTRQDFENGALDTKLLIDLYQSYNRLKNPREFVTRAQKMFPNLNCGLASVYLKHLFKKGEIIKGKYADESHTFLQLDNNLIVDITADQYGGPPIYVGPITPPYRKY